MVELIAQEPQPTPPPIPVFEKFPMVMRHPHERKSVPVLVPGTQRHDAMGNPIAGTGVYQGTPDFMPPVHVHNQDQEDYYHAQGYVSAGTMDAAAFDRIAAAPIAPPHDVQEWPKWVNGKLCQNAEEEAAASGRVGQTRGEATTHAEPTPMTRSEKAKAAWAKRKAAK